MNSPKNAIIGAVVISLIIGGLLYYRHMQGQAAATPAATQQTQSQSVSEPAPAQVQGQSNDPYANYNAPAKQ